MGLDDDADCVGHDWALTGMHLSLERGTEQEERCAHCGTVRYVDDQLRNDPRRPRLPPTRPMRGIDT